MKLIIFLVLAVLVVADEDQDGQTDWENFKKMYNKTYENDLEEKSHYYTFLYNLEQIKKHNEKYEKGLVPYTYKITKWSDIHPKYFSGQFKLRGPPTDGSSNSSSKATFRALDGNSAEIPDSIDWRKRGKVTKVRDQGACESCWAFSSVEAVESQLLIKNKHATLSPQQLIDCSTTFGNIGCSGGWAHKSFNYIKAKGIEQEKDYPYTASDNRCKYDSSKVFTYITDYKSGFDEETLKEFIATRGPTSVFMNADTLQFYGGGIFDGANCDSSPQAVNHVLLAVGYGEEKDGTKYWIIKNSWGPSWGNNGYMKLLRGSNVCSIGYWSYVPIL